MRKCRVLVVITVTMRRNLKGLKTTVDDQEVQILKVVHKTIPNAVQLFWAGPTYLPHDGTILSAAIHLSDVSFFWEMAAKRIFKELPWAVTANVAFRKASLKGIRYMNWPPACSCCHVKQTAWEGH